MQRFTRLSDRGQIRRIFPCFSGRAGVCFLLPPQGRPFHPTAADVP